MIEFKLNEIEEKKAKDFIHMCQEVNKYVNSKDSDFKSTLTFQYVFSSSSGIGQDSAIECNELGIGISLTDYESW